MTAKTVEEVIAYALSFEGTVESPLGSNKVIFNDWYYGGRDNYGITAAWCDTFQSYVDAHCGVPVGPGPKGSAYTPSHYEWFKRNSLAGQTPKIGALVFFDFPGDGVNRISHVGRVVEIKANGIWCIEGNTDEKGGRTGGKVMKKFRTFGSYIKGYGYPQYGTGTIPQPHPIIQEEDDMAIAFLVGAEIATFSIGKDGLLVHRYYQEGQWKNIELNPDCVPGSQIGKHLNFGGTEGRIDVYADHKGGGLAHAWYVRGSGWATEVLT